MEKFHIEGVIIIITIIKLEISTDKDFEHLAYTVTFKSVAVERDS